MSEVTNMQQTPSLQQKVATALVDVLKQEIPPEYISADGGRLEEFTTISAENLLLDFVQLFPHK